MIFNVASNVTYSKGALFVEGYQAFLFADME